MVFGDGSSGGDGEVKETGTKSNVLTSYQPQFKIFSILISKRPNLKKVLFLIKKALKIDDGPDWLYRARANEGIGSRR